MVRIVNYQKRQAEDGRVFFALELSEGIEMVQSQNGMFYASSKRAFVNCTFDELTCKALLGTEMKGSITKQECEPYEYVNKETSEILTLHHRNVYVPEETSKPAPKAPVSDFEMAGTM